jgi:phenylalanyl-tRNA synthetase beta chain
MYGQPVEKDNIQPGDLVFYNTGERIIHYETQEFIPGMPVEDGIDHPAIYLGDGKVISATSYTGEVSVTDIDNPEFGEQIGIRRMAEGKRLRVQVPCWRQDLRQPEDLIEEVGRVYGYENIEKTKPDPTTDNPEVHKAFYYVQKIRDILSEAGLSEAYTYAFQDSGDIELKNPIAEDKTYLRSSLRSGLKQALEDNKKHKELLDGQEIDIFEVGNVFSDQKETLQLGLGTTGDKTRIENSVATIEDELGITIESSDKTWSDQNILLIDFDSVSGQLTAPDDYSKLKNLRTNTTYQPPSSYPYVLRDIAMWIPNKIESKKSKVESVIQETAGELLVNIKLFDEYDPDDQDRVSFAFRLVFQSNERTLEDEEVNEIMDDIHDAVVREGWEVR